MTPEELVFGLKHAMATHRQPLGVRRPLKDDEAALLYLGVAKALHACGQIEAAVQAQQEHERYLELITDFPVPRVTEP